MGTNDSENKADSGNDSKDGEYIAKQDQEGKSGGDIYAEIAAQITHYTDRPDLFLEVIEKHDPGFIKEMNKHAKEMQTRYSESRFTFGKVQAYTSLGVSVVAAIVIFACLVMLILGGHAGFWVIIALAVFYSISQGGRTGFLRIIKAVEGAINRIRGNVSDN